MGQVEVLGDAYGEASGGMAAAAAAAACARATEALLHVAAPGRPFSVLKARAPSAGDFLLFFARMGRSLAAARGGHWPPVFHGPRGARSQWHLAWQQRTKYLGSQCLGTLLLLGWGIHWLPSTFQSGPLPRRTLDGP